MLSPWSVICARCEARAAEANVTVALEPLPESGPGAGTSRAARPALPVEIGDRPEAVERRAQRCGDARAAALVVGAVAPAGVRG